MRLSIRSLACAMALLWGGGVLSVGALNLVFPSYGLAFLQVVASVYPGFHAQGSMGDLAVGTIYALVDGTIAGLLLGWLYNGLLSRLSGPPGR